ncbi:MAG: hypothetical protein PHX08_05230 [Lachnospiraceae bacterium]|nr:hypothetical protein [Lachnospiraceae bacterium]
MEIKDYFCRLVLKMNDVNFELLKERLIGEYFSFQYIEEDAIDRIAFAEKLFDYFDKIEIKTGKKDILSSFIENLDAIVGRRIKKTPQTKKGEQPQPVPRARKYYENACEIKKTRKYTGRQIEDYSRIMLCLYMEGITSKDKEIEDFEFALNSIDVDRIILAMKEEKPVGLFGGKQKFDTKDLYSYDTCTFIVTMLICCYMKSNEIEGEY